MRKLEQRTRKGDAACEAVRAIYLNDCTAYKLQVFISKEAQW